MITCATARIVLCMTHHEVFLCNHYDADVQTTAKASTNNLGIQIIKYAQDLSKYQPCDEVLNVYIRLTYSFMLICICICIYRRNQVESVQSRQVAEDNLLVNIVIKHFTTKYIL
jgi:hypothetical protein